MPEDRPPATTPPTDDAPPPPPAPSAGGFKPWLPLIITTIFMPALAFGMAQFVILPQLQKGLGITAPSSTPTANKPKKDASKEKTVTVPMNKLLVNVAGTMGARYLLVSLSVVGAGTDFKAKIDEHEAQLRDMACGVLGAKSLADLEKPGERNLIRNELISGFNSILGDSTVQEIYLPEFAIQ
jgi:flagellar FliL protein